MKKIVEETSPSDKIREVEVEGPKVVLYTDDMPFFIDNSQQVRDLATSLKKRIIVRSTPQHLLDPIEAKKKITKLIPEEANIESIEFDEVFGEVRIEAEKLGLVIGKHGSTLDEITRQTHWNPKLLRKAPIQSDVVRSIRKTLYENAAERKKILESTGHKIYRKPDAPCDWVRMTPLGGSGQVGRSCFLMQTPESNVLVDCGINVAAQGQDRFPDLRASKLAISELDAVVISHAHLDHCGFLPYLYKYGYDGPVYCTEPTRDLMAMLVLDAVEIGVRNKNELPFGSKEVRRLIKHTITLEYQEVADITPDIHLTLYNAGHIIGSSMCHFHVGEGLHNIVYTGDFKFGDTRLLEAASFSFPRVESVIMESTYGGRYDIQPKRREAEKELVSQIQRTVERGGKVLIPVFAVGRSQEVMLVLENAYRYHDIDVPIYLDGMIWEATAIHTCYPEYLKNKIKHRVFNGYNPFLAETFQKVQPKMRRDIIDSDQPCVILATAGMMTGGPSVEYFKAFADDERNTLAFVGYQAEGSLGRRLQNGLKEVPIEDNNRTKKLKVNLEVKVVDGFSGHADRRQLLGYSKKINPKPGRALIVHGEQKKSQNLAATLNQMFGFNAQTPLNLDSLRLV
ncbi:MAG: beta-CASP ribonuclease aCPSF1 [Candidatus Altiarchaeales archaeon]|nr:beta-CASP ribonuclease aCPSF1 [Candidatus Altiarchaeales archaeon]